MKNLIKFGLIGGLVGMSLLSNGQNYLEKRLKNEVKVSCFGTHNDGNLKEITTGFGVGYKRKFNEGNALELTFENAVNPTKEGYFVGSGSLNYLRYFPDTVIDTYLGLGLNVLKKGKEFIPGFNLIVGAEGTLERNKNLKPFFEGNYSDRFTANDGPNGKDITSFTLRAGLRYKF